MVGLHDIHMHKCTQKMQVLQRKCGRKVCFSVEIKVSVYLLRQLEILHQVLLALSQLKDGLEGDREFENKDSCVSKLVWVNHKISE